MKKLLDKGANIDKCTNVSYSYLCMHALMYLPDLADIVECSSLDGPGRSHRGGQVAVREGSHRYNTGQGTLLN